MGCRAMLDKLLNDKVVLLMFAVFFLLLLTLPWNLKVIGSMLLFFLMTLTFLGILLFIMGLAFLIVRAIA